MVVIIKPAFSLTRERNVQRLIGTLLGIVIALCLLHFVTNTALLLGLASVFLLIYFTFNRIHHLLSVIALTPLVITLLYVYGNSGWGFVLERMYDTLIGCAIAFGATYLFPSWESIRVLFLCRELLKFNVQYLGKLEDALRGEPTNVTAYKLAWKRVYLGQANLSQSFQRMLIEPGNQAIISKYMYHFQMLNHILSANIASLFRSIAVGNQRVDPGQIKAVKDVLVQSLLYLDPSPNEGISDDSEERVKEILDDASEKHQDPFFLLNKLSGQIRVCCLELRALLV
ncbi:FUSC family protein [Siphonobacter sp. BAB-5385]|uniref:FUSC family protein n=1 Tax=Siphonobacter sp. BAB-5385 TaxID=1864822 RepID=UPI0026C5061E|nr:FUSC family protein [Siphonobacter sp. BAB-5385]